MNKATDSERPDSGLICSWCGRSFGPESTDQARALVCPRCLRLLRDAGVSDKEIYNDPSRKRGKTKAAGVSLLQGERDLLT